MRTYLAAVLALAGVAQLFLEPSHVMLMLLELRLQRHHALAAESRRLDEGGHQALTGAQLRPALGQAGGEEIGREQLREVDRRSFRQADARLQLQRRQR